MSSDKGKKSNGVPIRKYLTDTSMNDRKPLPDKEKKSSKLKDYLMGKKTLSEKIEGWEKEEE